MDWERWVEDLRGGEILLFERVLLSTRLSEFDELDEFVCCIAADGWDVRARDERRGVMIEWLISCCNATSEPSLLANHRDARSRHDIDFLIENQVELSVVEKRAAVSRGGPGSWRRIVCS